MTSVTRAIPHRLHQLAAVGCVLAAYPAAAALPPILLDFEGTSGGDLSHYYFIPYGLVFTNAHPIVEPAIVNEPSSYTAARLDPANVTTIDSLIPISGFSFYMSSQVDVQILAYAGNNGEGQVQYAGLLSANWNTGCAGSGKFCHWDLLDFFGNDPSKLVQSIVFRSDAVGPAVIDDLKIQFDESSPGPLQPVPEPATWAMLIAAFGAIGTRLRARSRALVGQAV